jgi:hypothetical protein
MNNISPDSWTATDRRIGLWSALAVLFLAIAYILTGAVGLMSRGGISLDYLPPEPYLTICRSLMVAVMMAWSCYLRRSIFSRRRIEKPVASRLSPF